MRADSVRDRDHDIWGHHGPDEACSIWGTLVQRLRPAHDSIESRRVEPQLRPPATLRYPQPTAVIEWWKAGQHFVGQAFNAYEETAMLRAIRRDGGTTSKVTRIRKAG